MGDFEVLARAGAVERPDRGRRRLRRRRVRAARYGRPGPTRSASTSTSRGRSRPIPDGRYLEGGAEALPLADASVDIAVLMRSLHHVPDPDSAFPELRRVVRDLVYVAEPLPTGNFFELMLPVDDETEVRAAAQAAIARAAGFERISSVEYDIEIRFDAFEDFRDMLLAADPDRAEQFAAVEDELRAAFRPGAYDAPMRADLLRVVSSAP